MAPRNHQVPNCSLAPSRRSGPSTSQKVATPVTEQLVLPLDMEVTQDAEPTVEVAAPKPVLITEAEVVFSTAAAVPLRRAPAGWRTRAGRVAVAVRGILAGTVTDERPTPRHHPKRLRYLNDARMEREMQRL